MSVDVETLIQDHRKAYTTPEGTLEFHTAPGLLAQLRDAMYGGNVSDGAGGGSKSKLPLQAAAIDLYMRIDRQIAEAWVQAFNRPPSTDRAERLLGEWGAWATEETVVEVDGRTRYAPAAVAHWIQLIEDYLIPPRLAPIDLPCPSCGTRHQYRDVDGEQIQTATLFFRRDRSTGDTLDARCETCGVVWLPAQFMFFLTALNAGSTAPTIQQIWSQEGGAE